MADTTTIRIDREIHRDLKRLAEERHATISDTVARGVRLLRQEEIGQELTQPLTDDETEWLDAELG